MSPYDIIPLVIIIISMLGIIFIVARKFPVLAAIDVGAIKSEQEAAKKEKIIASRLERKINGFIKFFSKFFSPVQAVIKNLFRIIYGRARNLENKYKKIEKVVSAPEEIEQKIKALFFSAEEFLKAGSLNEAEKKYIEIISLDHKNIEAYKKLGEIYLEQKNYDHAEETFQYILKLDANDIETLFDLGLLFRERKEFDKALQSFARVVELEPTNPRNLDFLIDISIIVGNKDLAEKALGKLTEVNPDNQKLAEFKERIKNI
jgi:tetratricopeptide (TPR) repeat protein